MHSSRHALFQFMRWALGLPLLAVACFGSWMALYGGVSPSAARLEASRLADAELSELAGTDNYLTSRSGTNSHSGIDAVVRSLPLANPSRMLEAEFPAPAVGPITGASQSGLAASLYEWQTQTNKIVLGWAQYDTAAHLIAMMEQNPGLTVLSPKWLNVQDASGTIRSRINDQVIDYAHAHHIAVWALFDNQFNAQLTHQVLTNGAARQAMVRQLAALAAQNRLDGINVDFENVRSEDRDTLNAFLHDLHAALRTHGVVLSVDVTPDIVFLRDEAAFFHAGLAADCDYVVLMAYDEHWGGDQTPGPVADVPWVTQSVEDLLNTGVPADKLILGLPFYTRFWYVHTDGSVQSQAVKASSVDAILRAHGATPMWNDELGVMYAKYPKEDGYMEVWFETGQTMDRKLRLVADNGLAGVAIWSLSLSDQQTWSTVIDTLRRTLS
jgi:spore germination protein YaaH